MKLNPSNIPIGTKVKVFCNDGKEVIGTLTDHNDWLVGCPVVKTDDGYSIGIGYQGHIVCVIPQGDEK